MALVGLGMDVCSIERIKRLLQGPLAQRFLARVFTPAERGDCGHRADAPAAFAARIAAKEALVKALGAPPGIRWTDMEVVRLKGPPTFRLTGTAQEEVSRRRASVLLALTHDAGVAAATVILQQEGE